MGKGVNSNEYEEARNRNILQNLKKLEEFGLQKTAKTLADLSRKKPKQTIPNPVRKARDNIQVVEPRRSSRARTLVSYRDQLDIDLSLSREMRSRKIPSSWGSYVARPEDELRLASFEERTRAMQAAQELQRSLQLENPSFVKSMVRSHVYSCFWLGLPTDFVKTHLPKSTVDMKLEDEDGKEFPATYIGQRVGLSGGWRAFALEHKLDDGDALVFELIEPRRFKIYITRVSSVSSWEHSAEVPGKEVIGAKKTSEVTVNLQSDQTRKSKKAIKGERDDLPSPQELRSHNGVFSEGRSDVVNPSKKKDIKTQKVQKKGKSLSICKTEEEESVENGNNRDSYKPRKRRERLFRKRV
ncbi:B3 domain-containing protein [Cephalotus follicularis]|uniref:B3 domain-containing protein n=1 Tax=Cephalotus follicularis TaxID=3775 RepID=A0A1Q3AS81_CEPFO|nr:B3 domain-containing protein [Cephalotus follicularis]